MNQIKRFFLTNSINKYKHKWDWNKFLEVLIKNDETLSSKQKVTRINKIYHKNIKYNKNNEKKEGFPWE